MPRIRDCWEQTLRSDARGLWKIQPGAHLLASYSFLSGVSRTIHLAPAATAEAAFAAGAVVAMAVDVVVGQLAQVRELVRGVVRQVVLCWEIPQQPSHSVAPCTQPLGPSHQPALPPTACSSVLMEPARLPKAIDLWWERSQLGEPWHPSLVRATAHIPTQCTQVVPGTQFRLRRRRSFLLYRHVPAALSRRGWRVPRASHEHRGSHAPYTVRASAAMHVAGCNVRTA